MNSTTKKFTGAVLAATGLFALASWMAPGYYRMAVENDFLRSLKKKTTAYTDKLPEDRVYLQFDKPFYNPGETIWFSAFVRDGQSLKKSGQSDIVHVDLVNPKGTTEKTISLIAKNGVAEGDFSLSEEALGGIYKIKAYTNWQKNDGGNYGFEKDLQVQDVVLPNLKMKLDFIKKAYGPGDEVEAKIVISTNENKPLSNFKLKYVADINGKQEVEETTMTNIDGMKIVKFKLPNNLKSNDGLVNIMIDYNGNTESISRSIPIVLGNINLTFFPEGGDLVSDVQSNVAFRALNEFNKPADVEGVIKTSDGKQVAEFSSFHMGMGSFSFKPETGVKYVAEITKPEGMKKQYDLPQSLDKGYVLSTDNTIPGEVALNISSTESEQLSVVAQVRGKIYYATAFDVKPGANKLLVPVGYFPMGVAQFTIFDSKGIARAERLTFVNRDKQLKIKIETDKEKYLPREKVKMTISVADENGMPMPGNFSLSVVNDQLLSFADDRSGNIVSKMLLEYDIKDKVEEPQFYFDKKEAKSNQALDYLLMTSGWRRFGWEKVDQLPMISYEGERALISGTVMDAYTGKPVSNASIKLNSSGSVFKTDEYGRFIFNKIDLTQPETFTVSANNYTAAQQYVNAYGQNVVYYLYGNNYGYYNYPSSVSGSGGGFNNVPNDDAPMKQMEMEDMVVNNEVQVKEHMKKAPVMAPKKSGGKSNMNEGPMGQNFKMDEDKKKEDKDLDANKQDNSKDQHERKDMKIKVGDLRSLRLSADSISNVNGEPDEQNMSGTVYYRAKQFAAPVYDKQEQVEQRSDFRSTIYWKGNVETDRTGKNTVEFYNSDDISSFRATVEGFGADGMTGHGDKTFFTQLPFSMTLKAPVEVATTDIVSIPLTLKNNTTASISGMLDITAPSTFKLLSTQEKVYTIAPGKGKTIFVEYKVLDAIGEGDFSVSFKSCGLSDAFTQKIKTVAKGFPVNISFSGSEMRSDYTFDINSSVDGSLNVHFTAFPSVVNDLLTGVDGILREPSGCFEQTSMSSYPNIMAMDYMKTMGKEDPKTIAYAGDLIDRGYKRLTTFETPKNGYEWFGAAPGHQGLTAYGLMQFNDMKNVYDGVSKDMIDRTAKWLMSQKDGKGGWSRNTQAYHNFGQISEEIMNGYIVYALAEAGYRDFKPELDASVKRSMDTKDPYQLAMMGNALQKFGDSRSENVMDLLIKTQKEDGSFTGSTHSITYSQGQSLTIETTSIAIMAMLKSPNKYVAELNKAVQFLVKSRSGYGVFGNTQGTVLALKALTEYAKQSKKTAEDGTVEIYSGNKKIGEHSYKAGETGTIQIDSLGKYFSEGKNDIKVKFVGTKTPLPYSIGIDYNTSLPPSSPECNVEIKTKLSAKTAFVGETVRLNTTLENHKNEGLPSTMAIIGIPGGMTAQPWQLKELQDKKIIDYYEVMGNNVVFYFRSMAPNEKKEINLDLKAEMPGEYDAPASSAYLYYTNEYKCWSSVDRITIKKPIN
jgi:hypothetical protein